MRLRFAVLYIVLTHSTVQNDEANANVNFKGHAMSVGFQGTPLGNIPEIRFSPSGQYFYENYIRQRRPVVVRNAASHWLATKKWPNETYLKDMYGDVPFKVNMQKVYENSVNVHKDMKLSEFLEIYKEQPVYLDSPFPPTNMINEISLPPLLQCSELSSTISDVFLLMSSGNSSSPLHQDGYENILIVISGTKKITLFNSSYSENVYADDFDVLPGLSPITPGNVDLIKYPKFAGVSFYESTLRAGDLVYIPQFWWHHVYSYNSPNIGVNIWFAMFNYESQFEKSNVSEDKNVVKTTMMFDELVKQEPSQIECKEQSPSLDHVLKIVLSHTSSETLRIPKASKRPPDFKLASGYTMPPLGFGTAGLYPEDTLPALLSALEAGYRLVDTAQIYGTEAAVAQAIKQSNIPRSEMTIVTKLHPKNHGYHPTISSVEESLKNLQTDYIDVFLIHTKECSAGYFRCPEGKPEGTWQDSWRAMEHLHNQGRIRSLGVSNFDVADLNELLNLTTVPLSVVQNWFDPLHQEINVRQFCAKHGIHFMGYSTLGTQWTAYGGMEKNPVLTSLTFMDIASHHQFVVAQVILRWAIHLNVTVIPRSHDPRHILLNIQSLDIELTENEIKTITEEWLPASSLDGSKESVLAGDKEDAEIQGTSTNAGNYGVDGNGIAIVDSDGRTDPAKTEETRKDEL